MALTQMGQRKDSVDQVKQGDFMGDILIELPKIFLVPTVRSRGDAEDLGSGKMIQHRSP